MPLNSVPQWFPWGGAVEPVAGPFCVETGRIHVPGMAAGAIVAPGGSPGEGVDSADGFGVIGCIYAPGVATIVGKKDPAGLIAAPGEIAEGRVCVPGAAAGLVQCEMDTTNPDPTDV